MKEHSLGGSPFSAPPPPPTNPLQGLKKLRKLRPAPQYMRRLVEWADAKLLDKEGAELGRVSVSARKGLLEEAEVYRSFGVRTSRFGHV